ncbi:hypothetical protein BH11ARM2_BH11ARM2_27770 [soil metagenome]
MGAVVFPTQGLVALDSAPLIYIVEQHPVYLPHLAPLWKAAEEGDLTLVISELALSEALVLPLRQANQTMIDAYGLVAEKSGIRVEPVSWRFLRRSAELRAQRPGLRMPDAIHVATADLTECDVFLTNDKSLRSVPLPSVVVLDDLI